MRSSGGRERQYRSAGRVRRSSANDEVRSVRCSLNVTGTSQVYADAEAPIAHEAEFLSHLLVAHDLSVVRHIADCVAVMYLGRIPEIGGMDDVLDRPVHPYTRGADHPDACH